MVPGPGPHRPSGGAHSWSRVEWCSLGVSDARSPGSLQPPHSNLFPLAPGRRRWGLSGLCEWQSRVAGGAESAGQGDGKAETQRPGPDPGGISGAVSVPVAPRCGRLSPACPSGPCGSRSQVPGGLPHLPLPHTPPATLWFLRGGKGVSLELNLGGQEGARSGADISEIQCIQKRHECLILFY